MLNSDDPAWMAQFTRTLLDWLRMMADAYPMVCMGDTIVTMQGWLHTCETATEYERAALWASFVQQVGMPYLALSDQLAELKEGRDRECWQEGQRLG